MTGRTFEPTLSAREQEILELVAVGLSAKEVAGELGIAPRTVDSHIEHIRLKLGARNRVQMVAKALLCGQIELGSSKPGDEKEAALPGEVHLNGTSRNW